MAIEAIPLSRHIGAEIRGVDLRTRPDAETIAAIYQAWLDHLVLVFPDQKLSQEDFLRVTEYFGEVNVPLFKTVYAPVKQIVAAFSPDSETGFKKVVVIDDAQRGMVFGFLTREFTMDRGKGPEAMVAVYVPTNHLYLGDVFVYPRGQALYPDLSVEEGIRIFLTGGMALPGAIKNRQQSRVKS